MLGFKWSEIASYLSVDANWSHSGIGVLSTGEIAFAHPDGRSLVILEEETGDVRSLSIPSTELHGIFVSRQESGDVLWAADPGLKPDPASRYQLIQRAGKVLRIDLASGVIDQWRTPAHIAYAVRPWRPTSAVEVVLPDTRQVWVADGYGENLVHLFDERGEHQVALSGTDTGRPFKCPHGLGIDARAGEPEVVIADRSNARLLWYSTDGVFQREIRDPLIREPTCLVANGDDLLVTDLGGALLSVDIEGHVRAEVDFPSVGRRPGWPNAIRDGGLVRPEVEAGELNAPHGIAVSPSGAIYLTGWELGGRQIRLTRETATLS